MKLERVRAMSFSGRVDGAPAPTAPPPRAPAPVRDAGPAPAAPQASDAEAARSVEGLFGGYGPPSAPAGGYFAGYGPPSAPAGGYFAGYGPPSAPAGGYFAGQHGWTATHTMTPEMRVQTRAGFRAAFVDLGQGAFFLLSVPDYATNYLASARGQLNEAKGIGGWSGDELLPPGVRQTANRSFREIVPRSFGKALRRVLKPSYGAALTDPTMNGGQSWERMPRGVKNTLPEVASQALPAALNSAMANAVADVGPVVIAPALVEVLQGALPRIIATAKAAGGKHGALLKLMRLLPDVARELPRITMDAALPAAVQASIPAELEITIPAAMESAFAKRVDPAIAAPPSRAA